MKTLRGTAAVYGDPTAIDVAGTIYEEIDFGAFRDSINEQRVIAYLQHDSRGQPLGRQSNNTLRLNDQPAGLRFELDPADTSLGRDVTELVRRRDLAGMSFGFIPQRESVYKAADGRTVFVIEKAILLEVSLVASPAYPQTNVTGRDTWDAEAELLRLQAQRLAWSRPRSRPERTQLRMPRQRSTKRYLTAPLVRCALAA